MIVKYFKYDAFVYVLSLLIALSCSDQRDPAKLNITANLRQVQDSLPLRQDTLSFPLDSLPVRITQQFKHIAETNETIVLEDTTFHQKAHIVHKSVLEIDGHQISYTALFSLAGNEPPYGETRLDNYLSARVKFDQKEFDVQKLNIIGIHPLEKKTWKHPITFAPEGEYLDDYNYKKIQLGDKTYYILSTGPFGCGICGYAFYYIFELSDKHKEVKLYTLVHESDIWWSFDEIDCGDINDDNIIDFYLEYDIGSKKSGYSLMVPVSLETSRNYLLQGAPIFYMDKNKKEAKIYGENPHHILDKKKH